MIARFVCGMLRQEGLTGHTDRVRCVACSPDGQYIMSSSRDRTIRVWTGEAVGGPFTGHTDSVLSVAFSPDGQHIVSGSRDHTVRVWNAMTGETEAGGHTSSVPSSTPSPAGQIIVSGSDDCMIRLVKNMFGGMERTVLSDSMNQSKIDHEGWITGDDGALVLWIPQIHRSSECIARPISGFLAHMKHGSIFLGLFMGRIGRRARTNSV